MAKWVTTACFPSETFWHLTKWEMKGGGVGETNAVLSHLGARLCILCGNVNNSSQTWTVDKLKLTVKCRGIGHLNKYVIVWLVVSIIFVNAANICSHALFLSLSSLDVIVSFFFYTKPLLNVTQKMPLQKKTKYVICWHYAKSQWTALSSWEAYTFIWFYIWFKWPSAQPCAYRLTE